MGRRAIRLIQRANYDRCADHRGRDQHHGDPGERRPQVAITTAAAGCHGKHSVAGGRHVAELALLPGKCRVDVFAKVVHPNSSRATAGRSRWHAR